MEAEGQWKKQKTKQKNTIKGWRKGHLSSVVEEQLKKLACSNVTG